MRAPLALPVLLALLTAPVAQAAVLEDPAGDLSLLLAGQAIAQGGATTSTFTALDLRALDIQEDPAGFRFQVSLADLGEDEARHDYGSAIVRFSFGGCRFHLVLYRASDNAAYFASLYRAVGDGALAYVRGLPAERDLANDVIWSTLSRFDITGDAGQMPGRGDVLADVRVDTYSFAVGSGFTRVGDAMPDGAVADGGASYAVQYGGAHGEGATLATSHAFRSSNGAATTYLFDVSASHDGKEAARFHLTTQDVPPGWNVTLPGNLVEVPAGLPVVFPVYVTTVFRHQHGAVEDLQLHLHEADGARWASLDLGVHFLAVAQPAGHHPRLHLHSSDWASTAEAVNAPLGGTGGYLTMNTLEEDPADTRKPSLGRSQVPGVNSPAGMEALGTVRFQWSACLEPGLDLGLDFDLARQGTITVPISTTRPLPGATLTGRLLHVGPGEPMQYCFPYYYQERATTVLAELDLGQADLGPNGEATFSGAIQALPAADAIAAQPGSSIILELELVATGIALGGVAGAYLEPGAWMELPLNEYDDGVRVVPPAQAEPVAGFVESAPAKESPGLGLLGLASIAALAGGLRRVRRT